MKIDEFLARVRMSAADIVRQNPYISPMGALRKGLWNDANVVLWRHPLGIQLALNFTRDAQRLTGYSGYDIVTGSGIFSPEVLIQLLEGSECGPFLWEATGDGLQPMNDGAVVLPTAEHEIGSSKRRH